MAVHNFETCRNLGMILNYFFGGLGFQRQSLYPFGTVLFSQKNYFQFACRTHNYSHSRQNRTRLRPRCDEPILGPGFNLFEG